MTDRNPLSKNERRLFDLVKAYEQDGGIVGTTDFEPEDYADIIDWYDANYMNCKADEAMDRALTAYPDNTELMVQEANRLISGGQYEQAEKICSSLDDVTSAELTLLRARIMLLDGKDEEAQQLLDDFGFDLLDPVMVACMYLDSERPEMARRWLDGEFEYDSDDMPKDEFYYSTLANCEFASRHYDKALQIFDRLLDKDPFSSFYWLCEAKCHFMQGDYSKAIEACDFAVLNDSEFGEAYMLRAFTNVLIGNDSQAKEDYKHGMKESDEIAATVAEYVGDKLLSQQGDGKWEQMMRIIDLDIDNGVLGREDKGVQYLRKGLCLSRMGRHEEAMEMMRTAYTLNPHDTEAMLYEGHEYAVTDRLDEARVCWKMALCTTDSVLTDSEMYIRIGAYLFETGHIEEAMKYVERARDKNPDIPSINATLLSMALLLRDKKQIKKYNRMCAGMMSDSYIAEALELIESGDTKFITFLTNRINEGLAGEKPGDRNVL